MRAMPAMNLVPAMACKDDCWAGAQAEAQSRAPRAGLRVVLALALAFLFSHRALTATDAPPVEPPTPNITPASDPMPVLPDALPAHPAHPAHPMRPPAGVQEGPYYSVSNGAAGVLFQVSRSLEGETLSRRSADFRIAYARDWHRGDGGLGDWLGFRGTLRYRAAGLQIAFDDRRFGPSPAMNFQAAHVLLGGIVPSGHAKPFDDAGFGLCVWWPKNTGEVRVVPEVGFRATLMRWPAYRASLAAFRRGEAQGNSSFFMHLELFGNAGWNYKSVQGWIYDGGAQLGVGIGRFQAAVGYQIWGLRKHVAQGPVVTATIYF